MVAITERGGIAGQPRLARALAEGWVRCAERVGARAMEDVMRRTVIAVRLADQVRLLEALPEEELETLIDAEYRRAAGRVWARRVSYFVAPAHAERECLSLFCCVGDHFLNEL